MSLINLGRSNLEGAELSECHLLPCKIDSDCKTVKVSTYFIPTILENQETSEKVKEQELVESKGGSNNNEDKRLFTASFRGRPLQGRIVRLPEDYIGSIIESKDLNQQSSNVERKVIKRFDKFTYWNWDQLPTKEDNPVKALNWLNLAKAIHQ